MSRLVLAMLRVACTQKLVCGLKQGCFIHFLRSGSVDSCGNRMRRVERQAEEFQSRIVLDSIHWGGRSVSLPYGVCTTNAS